jgi:phage FluMu protein Com
MVFTVENAETPQIRCGNCDKLLGKGTALDLAIKCPRCGAINHIRSGRTADTEDRESQHGASDA